METESFKCICGESYDSIEALNDHWNDPDRKPGQHYRNVLIRGKSQWEPPMHKDGPQ
jgi:hypothetical protein